MLVRCHVGTMTAGASRRIRALRPEPSLLPPSRQRIRVRDAAEILGCSCSVVRGLLDHGMLRSRQFTDRGVRVTRESLLTFLRWFEDIEDDDDDRLKSRAPRRRGRKRK